MNKCILCTFFRMIWDGLRDNTCPSVDKKKDEKKSRIPKLIAETILAGICAVLIFGAIVFIGYWILFLIAWLLGVPLEYLLSWIATIGAMGGFGLLVYVIIESAKIRIECIKAYWRKAKEACE